MLTDMEAFENHLLILSDATGIAWVLSEGKMAFSDNRLGQARRLQPGDRVLVYATRKAFGNPNIWRGSLIAQARVAGGVHRLAEPVDIGERAYGHVVPLSVSSIAPFGSGVPLAACVDRLELFPDPRSWTGRIRRTVVGLPQHDADFLARELDLIASSPSEVLQQYQQAAEHLAAKRAAVRPPKQPPTLTVAPDQAFLLDLLA
jgi:hypothetical protein